MSKKKTLNNGFYTELNGNYYVCYKNKIYQLKPYGFFELDAQGIDKKVFIKTSTVPQTLKPSLGTLSQHLKLQLQPVKV